MKTIQMKMKLVETAVTAVVTTATAKCNAINRFKRSNKWRMSYCCQFSYFSTIKIPDFSPFFPIFLCFWNSRFSRFFETKITIFRKMDLRGLAICFCKFDLLAKVSFPCKQCKINSGCVFGWWYFWWYFKFAFRVNVFPHAFPVFVFNSQVNLFWCSSVPIFTSSHLASFSNHFAFKSLWNVLKCTLRFDLLINDLEQVRLGHLSFFWYPVCVKMCLLRFSFRGNDFRHSLHLNCEQNIWRILLWDSRKFVLQSE